ncbi:hypothetical protein HG536_0G03960 [Torulaspora globosa]|uniref:Nucleoporin Nup54 alpha-helical domain-containing protein n=1 Tax=Torulaspora globosa TaxID=48254 RepID=A0A7G3ZLZ8_9SACH|nr:uncharacterized protein HG536_0G03960 [Torulaspora globosa]QLL34534.1 hypothetical protein HG536_0G03960 [Torulaspora globosa]
MFSFNKASSAGASSTTSGGLFGQKPNNAGGGFSFGQTSGAGGNATGGGSGFSFGGQAAQSGDSKGGLFGNKPAGGTASGTGFSFGQQQQPQQPGGTTVGGLFGSKPVGSATGTGISFGQQSQSQQPAGTAGLFGNSGTNTGTGSLFGSSNSGTTGTTGAGGSLFGKTGTTAGSTGGGLFGSKPAGGSSLFGSSSGTGGGLFGSKAAGTSLFGTSGTSNASGSLFGAQQPQQYQQPSTLQAISQLPITPMTKISELPPQLRQEIEQLDQYIQRQVQISQHLKADTPEHTELINSIPRDIAYLLKTVSSASESLTQDLKKLTSIKDITDQSIADTQTFAMILQQLLTPGSKISSMELEKFFHHRIQVYQEKLDDYFRVLSDIESAVNGIDNDVFGAPPDAKGFSKNNESSGHVDVYAMKTGINALISTVIEEFSLFMDTAERVAQIHQKVKEICVNRSEVQS